MEKNIIAVKEICQLKKCEDFIFDEMKVLKLSFLKVSFMFNYIKTNNLYLHEGYDDFYTYVQEKFNLKATSCKNLIAIYNRFCKPVDYKGSNFFSIYLKDDYKDYSYSQLTELLSVDDISKYNPQMTIKEIRKTKSYDKLYDDLKQNYLIDLDSFINECIYNQSFKDLSLYKKCIYQFVRTLNANKIDFARYDFNNYICMEDLSINFFFNRYIHLISKYFSISISRTCDDKVFINCDLLKLKNFEIKTFDDFANTMVKFVEYIKLQVKNNEIKENSIIKEEEQKTNLIYSNDSITDLNIDEDIDEDISDVLTYINDNTKLANLSSDNGLLFKAKKYDLVEIPLGNKFILRLDDYCDATLIDIVKDKEYQLRNDDMLKLFLHLFEKLGTFRDDYLTETLDQVFNNIKEEIELSEDDLIDNTENYNFDNVE